MQKAIIGLYVITTSLALIVLKLGAKSGAPVHYLNERLHFNLNLYVLGGVALYGLSFLVYVYLISKYDLGYIIPLTAAFIYLIIFTASYFIFKENFTAAKIAGIALITAGIIFLNFQK
jgi:small multidrug resistance pump